MPIHYDEKLQKWRASAHHNGQRLHSTLPRGASKADAKKRERELHDRLESGAQRVLSKDPDLSEIMSVYLKHAEHLRSFESAKFKVLRLAPFVQGKRASQAIECAARFIEEGRAQWSAASINLSLSALKKGLSLAFMQGVTEVDYGARITRLPENNAREQHFTIDQIKHLCTHTRGETRAAVWVALYTGMRRGEILALRAEDVKPDHIEVRATTTKTLKTRHVPIVEPLRPWLHYIPFTITFHGLGSEIERARLRAGMPEFRFHDLRRSTATLLINTPGVELHVVSKVLGHSSVKVTEKVYAHLSLDRQADAMRAAFERGVADAPNAV